MLIRDQTLTQEIISIIQSALAEDIGDGDITTLSTVTDSLWLMGKFVARAGGVIAGMQVAQATFTLLDERVAFDVFVEDGQMIQAGQQLAKVKGPGRAILSGERTALNLLQRMSGIATQTRHFVEAVRGTNAVILDTRKTAPGLRTLDKLAVRIGGGQNHRTGLYDMALIKNNHIAAVGGDLAEAVRRVRASDTKHRMVEIEVRDLDQLRTALELDVDRILLDNMSIKQLRTAVEITSGRVALEASGGITLDNVTEVAKTGVDFISVGALTHSVSALDISLWIDESITT